MGGRAVGVVVKRKIRRRRHNVAKKNAARRGRERDELSTKKKVILNPKALLSKIKSKSVVNGVGGEVVERFSFSAAPTYIL